MDRTCMKKTCPSPRWEKSWEDQCACPLLDLTPYSSYSTWRRSPPTIWRLPSWLKINLERTSWITQWSSWFTMGIWEAERLMIRSWEPFGLYGSLWSSATAAITSSVRTGGTATGAGSSYKRSSGCCRLWAGTITLTDLTREQRRASETRRESYARRDKLRPRGCAGNWRRSFRGMSYAGRWTPTMQGSGQKSRPRPSCRIVGSGLHWLWDWDWVFWLEPPWEWSCALWKGRQEWQWEGLWVVSWAGLRVLLHSWPLNTWMTEWDHIQPILIQLLLTASIGQLQSECREDLGGDCFVFKADQVCQVCVTKQAQLVLKTITAKTRPIMFWGIG